MDASFYVTKMLSEPALRDFIVENVLSHGVTAHKFSIIKIRVRDLHDFMKSSKFTKVLPRDEKHALIESMRLTAHKLGNFMSEIVGRKAGSSKQCSSSGSHDLVKDWNEIQDLINGMLKAKNYFKHAEDQIKLSYNIISNMNNVENIENLLLATTDSSNCITLNEKQNGVLLLKKMFPALGKIHDFIYKLCNELGNLPWLICKACEGRPLALLLIGALLSHKPMTYDTWNTVKDDLVKIKDSNNHVTSNHMGHIFTYCYDDLPYFLQLCFLYFACYPIGYEIPATSLTKIWMAEGFVTPEKGETIEETANTYLEELVQRSLVCVSKRSFLGTIKICRVPRCIHEFAIKQSEMEGFLVANPDQEKIESLFRLAIHHDNKKQYTEVKNNHIHSFLAFNFDRHVLGSVVLLKVLELRKSAISVTALPNMISLQYLGLRGNNISELPKNIGDMENLLTLDVRDTNIKTLPESLWNIKTLHNVYVDPSPQIKGPPSKAFILDLHILKTVAAHESWAENIPYFLIHLRKLAFSNWDNLDWKYISNLLSCMDKLISMAIIGKIVPPEFVDTRAFPNLETVKSIKLEGEWNYKKLLIDNVKFPPNLTKLTLTKSGLKEDPMPTLERLQALKFLSLQDGAYTGKQMVCSTNGFPQLQFLELKKLENLEKWEMELTTMPKLSTLRVVQCRKLNNVPYYLKGFIDNVTDNGNVAFILSL